MALRTLTKEYSDKEILAKLDPLVRTWFTSKFKNFSPPQKHAVLSIHNRENTLISAPTGSGKTLSAFLSILNELIVLAKKGELEERVYCVYVSPLRALGNDIFINLERPLQEMNELHGSDLGIRVATRTGDTKPYDRTKMLKKPPHILITTPETLGILLVAPKFRELLRGIPWFILDEVHALAPNKRGTHLTLSLERLQQLSGPFTRIGLSATVAPLEDMARFLVGYEGGKERDCAIVDVQHVKKIDLKVISPVKNIITATQDELHEALYKTLDGLIQEHKTTLIFTNTRSATERVVHYLKTKFPKNYSENIGAHHSSLSRAHRLDIEERLRKGELKVAVSSTSLELGIDIGYIDLVVMLGSPKSVARALQRIGRSGHRLHDTVKGRFVVLDRDDLIECSVMLKNSLDGKIDRIDIPNNCLDVLAQHIYGIAIEDKQHIETVFDLVKRAYPYRNLSWEDFENTVLYLSGEYVELQERYVYGKIWYDRETKMIGRRGMMSRVIYATNIGTIPESSFMDVKIKDQSIGVLDEGFMERLKKGDIFVLGGNTYRFNFARGMTVQVTPTPGRVPTVPSWFSEMLPLSFDLAMDIQKFRRKMEEHLKAKQTKKDVLKFIHDYLYVDAYAANSIYEYFREQFLFAELPHDRKVVIEFYRGLADRKYVIFHTLFGRRTNDALSRAIAYSLSKMKKRNVAITLTDNGFYLTTDSKKLQVLRAFQDVTAENVRPYLEKSLENSEVLKRRFRHCAGRSLMVLRSYKGRRKSVGRQQVSSQILINAARRISEGFPILKEARREVLEDLMDVEHAQQIVQALHDDKIKTKIIATDIPSPFSLNLIARGYMDVIKVEDKLEFIRRMHQAVLENIKRTHGIELEALEEYKKKPKVQPHRRPTPKEVEASANFKRVERLKLLVMNLKHVPLRSRMELAEHIAGNGELSTYFLNSVRRYRSDVEANWPPELQKIVFDQLEVADDPSEKHTTD